MVGVVGGAGGEVVKQLAPPLPLPYHSLGPPSSHSSPPTHAVSASPAFALVPAGSIPAFVWGTEYGPSPAW